MQNPQPPAPILVALSPAQIDVSPGSPPVDMALSVRNNTQSVDQYGIEIEGLEPGWYSLDVQSLSLFPGDSYDGKLTVRIPPESTPIAGSYPFSVTVRSRSNPQVSGVARALARVGSAPAQRRPQAAGGRHSLWPLLLLLGLGVALLAVAAFVLSSGRLPFISAAATPLPATKVAQAILSPTPRSAVTPAPDSTLTARPLTTPVCAALAMEHRGKQNTRFTPGITDGGPFPVAGHNYKYKAVYTSVLYVGATGVVSSVRVVNLDVFKAGQQQMETITATLVSGTNVRVPIFTWTCQPGNLVSLHINLDDHAKDAIPYSCSENIAGTFKPDGGSFSTLVGQPAQGNWLLEMVVYSDEEWPTSYFNSWGMEMCTR
jgi:hypothetical protein